MGLDMYLRKRVYLRDCDFTKKEWQGKQTITVETAYEDGDIKKEVFTPDPEIMGSTYLVLRVVYWRKANAIHNWFVNNYADGVDNCNPIIVSGDDLIKLRDLCQQILKDHKLAEQLLPTQGGFFFGSTDYDDWYYSNLEDTVDMLKDIDENAMYEYQASW